MELQERDSIIREGQHLVEQFRTEAITRLPDWIKPYIEPTAETSEEFFRIGHGWESPEKALKIIVPGLAPIIFVAKDATYKSAGVSSSMVNRNMSFAQFLENRSSHCTYRCKHAAEELEKERLF